MKIGISATGPDLEAQVEPRFGRCPYFLIVDPQSLDFEALENPSTASMGGAGIQSAQLMSDKGVSTVLTGNCGPNAFRTFEAANIHVVTGVSGPVRQAVEQFQSGALEPSGSANVASHSGMGGGSGRGRGLGIGGGGGSGMGRGLGRQMGMGGGMGQGRRMNTDQAGTSGNPGGKSPSSGQDPSDELKRLKQEAEALQKRIQELESGGEKA
mgnify:FL=1